MKKAVLVKAYVMTRIIVDENDSYDNIIKQAKSNLLSNLNNDYEDCIDEIIDDIECPYNPEVVDINIYFKVNDLDIICRDDYESLPCPMYAYEFDDSKMQELAQRIYDEVSYYIGEREAINYFTDINFSSEDVNRIFWEAMENNAINMGMRYYDDMSDEEYKTIQEKWIKK